MECPHLKENVTLEAPSVTVGHLDSSKLWLCKACNTEKSPWICLNCGMVNCGRYVNGHAKEHHGEKNEHAVCMDCTNYAVFCYICDEFVINDTEHGHIDQVRKCLQSIQSLRERKKQLIEQLREPVSCNEVGDRFVSRISLRARDENRENEELIQRSNLSLDCDNHSNSSTQENNQPKPRRRESTETSDGGKCVKKLKTEDGSKVKPPRPKTSGLRNLGNTCFMNAVLQSLSNIHQFCGYIKQLPSLEHCHKVNNSKKKHNTRQNKAATDDIFLVEELRKTLIALWQGNKAAICPESLFSVIWKVVPRFRGYQQQDAHEFMRYLLDRLHTELLTLLSYPNSTSPYIGPKGKSTIVTAIFGGILQNEVNCLTCGVESKKHDPFLDLSLDIPSHFTSKTPKPREGETLCHLQDCLQSFTDVEQLEESELYMCSNCKRRQPSTKKFWIRRLPNVLCLHLKRFRWNTYMRVKVETFVEFPVHGLDMSHFVLGNLHGTRNSGGSNEYDLAAVIVHHGSGAGSGHYTAYAIHEGRWYHFNDSSVTACDEETVARCKAYILFYVRRELKIPDTLTKPHIV